MVLSEEMTGSRRRCRPLPTTAFMANSSRKAMTMCIVEPATATPNRSQNGFCR